MVGKNILIVEDDDSIREILKLALQLEGYDVHIAANGREGLEELSKMPKPCVILLDLMMPVMDGWAFSDALSQNPDWTKIPIVVVTAFSEKAATLSRVAKIIKKPVDLEFLLTTVRSYCAAEG